MSARHERPDDRPDDHRPGRTRRARAILRLVGADTMAEAGPTGTMPGLRISSDDLPPAFGAPWYEPPCILEFIDSATFGQDDPEALRAAGAKAVATALAGLCDAGRLAWRQDVREVAALIEEWLASDCGAFDDLAGDIGLRPVRGPSLSVEIRRAQRDDLLRHLALRPPFASMSPRAAAKAMRAGFANYEARTWPREQHERKTATAVEPAATWWRIARLGLAYPMPNAQTLAALIERTRARNLRWGVRM